MKKLRFNVVESDDDEPQPKRPLKLTMSDDDELSQLQFTAESVTEQPYYPQTLTDDQAARVVATLVLAQQLVDKDARCYLQVGGAVEYPSNQQGVVSRQVFASIAVRLNMETLVCKRFTYNNVGDFGLKCQFTIGDDAAYGVPANNVRVPLPLRRRGAIEVPWAAYNSAVFTDDLTSSDRALVVFIDKPNLPLNGDSFFLETSDTGVQLNEVGGSPNDDASESDSQRTAMIHFYDELFTSIVSSTTARNMYNENESLVRSPGTSVNIKISNASPVSTIRWNATLAAVKKHLTTPARIEYVVGQTIKRGVAFV